MNESTSTIERTTVPRKKTLILMLMLLAAMLMICFGNVEQACAATYANKTANSAVDWCSKQVGKSIEVNDARYKYQCVDFVMAYYRVVGGFVFPEKPGAERGRIAPGEIGRAKVVRMSTESTWIYGGDGTDRAVKERMVAIKREIETASLSFEREELQERLLALVG